MSTNKYRSIFLRQMVTIVYIFSRQMEAIQYSLYIPQFLNPSRVAKNIWRNTIHIFFWRSTIASIWGENMLRYLSADIIFSEKRTVSICFGLTHLHIFFRRFASTVCIWFEFWLIRWIFCVLCDLCEGLLWFWTHLKTVLNSLYTTWLIKTIIQRMEWQPLPPVEYPLLLFLTGCRPTHRRSKRAQEIEDGMLLM